MPGLETAHGLLDVRSVACHTLPVLGHHLHIVHIDSHEGAHVGLHAAQVQLPGGSGLLWKVVVKGKFTMDLMVEESPRAGAV